MKTFVLFLLLCLGFLGAVSPLSAKPKKHHDGAQPSPAPESAVKSGDLPSVSLQPFVDAHLGQMLAPLSGSPFDKPEMIASLKAAYADGQAVAPATRQPAFQAAQNVCDAFITAMAEREKAAAALKGSTATHSSETENQPKGGRKAVRHENQHSDNFFADGLSNEWAQHADALRKNVMALYLHERDLERQAIATEAAAAATPAPAPAAKPAALSADSVSAAH